nr:hypothetical protein [Deltaproteobacteria bacterium]
MHLDYTRDGKLLALADTSGVSLIDVRTGERRHRISVTGVQALACAGDQLWLASREGVLTRCAFDGRVLGEHPLSLDHTARLIAAQVGPAAALWTAGTPVLLVDDLGTIASLPAEADALAPVAGRRYVRGARERLVLP